jgi:hypothetical protein
MWLRHGSLDARSRLAMQHCCFPPPISCSLFEGPRSGWSTERRFELQDRWTCIQVVLWLYMLCIKGYLPFSLQIIACTKRGHLSVIPEAITPVVSAPPTRIDMGSQGNGTVVPVTLSASANLTIRTEFYSSPDQLTRCASCSTIRSRGPA